ncbi:MAG TPA: TonB-dependent receptor [Acidobacteriaceae bacterium]|jgi:outer membrane receptor protein involved in Fe transport|nr:TonB-dependent receptor [Acidobacteriaceae bacterium]
MVYATRLHGSLKVGSIFGGLFLSLILLLSGASFAQLSTASINGVVRDPSGAVVPDATIMLRNIQTSVENTTTSNSAGVYSIFNITPGQYTIEATAPGFGPKSVPLFTLTVGHTATINFSMVVGSQSSTVTVQAANPQLQVSSANLGTVISTKEVNDLPLNGRNFTQLLTLTPGVTPTGVGTGMSEGSVGGGGWMVADPIGSDTVFPDINGQSDRSNFFLTDGMNNYGEYISTYAVPPIIDAIQEFKVVSHTDSAEYGGSLGGVINVTTKSGTNNLHGSAWEYARNEIFDARGYFLPTTVPKTPYSQNQFGGSIGGPVWIPKLYNGRNKTFFFGAYQGFRYSLVANAPLHVATARELSGDLSDWPTQIYNPFSFRPNPAAPGEYIGDPFPGNQIPASMIQKPLVAYANFAYPQAGPVFDSSGDNALDTTPVGQVQNEWDIRVDQKIAANDSAYFRYSALNSTVTASSGLPGDPSVTPIPSRNWGGSYVHVFNPSLVLQGQVAHTTLYMTESNFFTQSTTAIAGTLNLAPNISTWAAAPGRSILPGMSIAGFSSNPGEFLYTAHSSDTWEYSGSLQKTLGAHALHFGGGYTTMKFGDATAQPIEGFGAQNTADPNPLDTTDVGSGLASYLLGVPSSYNFTNRETGSRPGGIGDAYVQDAWKVTPKLTLNYGLRYDVTFITPMGKDSLVPFHGGPYDGNMDYNNGTYIVQKLPPACNVTHAAPCIPGDGTLPAHVVVSPNGKLIYNTYNNFGPRVGFAYQIGNSAVVRGAFGVVYDNWAAVTMITNSSGGTWPDIGFLESPADLNLPSSASATPTVTATNPLGASSEVLPAATPFNQTSPSVDPHLKNPMSEQWNLGGEWQLNSTTVATLDYVGMVSQRLAYGGPYNTALTPGPGDPQSRALYPYIAIAPYDRSVGRSNYNALQFSLIKRYANGWSYNVAYTWSKTIDCGTDGWFGAAGTNAQDTYNICGYGSRSVAGYDITNVLTVDTLYQIPVGRDKRFSTRNGALNYILGNWQVNNIFTAHSGIPFTPVISSDIPNTGNGTEYLNLVGNPNLSHRTPAEWFNTAAYAVPPGYTYGTAGRNSLRSAGSWDLDSSVFRLFPIGEGRQFEFRMEAFNLLNNVVLGEPIADYNAGPLFGTINGTFNTARQLQLALKFIF